MQQLSLEQLEVESYAVQPSEMELTDLKGGTIMLPFTVYHAAKAHYERSYNAMATAIESVELGANPATAYEAANLSEAYAVTP